MAVAGATAGAAYYAYCEYRAWWDVTDKTLAGLEDIHLALERLNGTAHRLESRLEHLASTRETRSGTASAKKSDSVAISDHEAKSDHGAIGEHGGATASGRAARAPRGSKASATPSNSIGTKRKTRHVTNEN